MGCVWRMDRENGMRAGRCRVLVRKIRPCRDAELENLGRCYDARGSVRKDTEPEETRRPHKWFAVKEGRQTSMSIHWRSTASYRRPPQRMEATENSSLDGYTLCLDAFCWTSAGKARRRALPRPYPNSHTRPMIRRHIWTPAFQKSSLPVQLLVEFPLTTLP
jgi:hypothetical protein